MEIFAPVISICITCVIFLIYLNIYYDVSCQKLFEREDIEFNENDNDDGNYNLDIR